MASASTPSVNEPTRVVHTEKLKPMIKGPISVSSGISHIAFASVYSEKTRMKKLMIMIIIIIESSTTLSDIEYIARNDGFSRAPEIDNRYETKARKVMVDFKFDALYS